MNKKLSTAVFFGALVSRSIAVEAGVTVYGIADADFVYRSNHTISGVNGQHRIDGIHSRFGFRGVEDLGNGIKAGFVIERGVQLDTNAESFNRQSLVWLGGRFGRLSLGRQYSPRHLLMVRLDPFQVRPGTKMNTIYKSYGDVRIDNAVVYNSPNIRGFMMMGMFSVNRNGEEKNRGDGNIRFWALSPRYSKGALDVQLNYHERKPDTSNANMTRVWDLAGGYNFKLIKVSGFYGIVKSTGVQDVRHWMIGGNIPVGSAGKVLLSYVEADDRIEDKQEHQVGLGYFHSLSKRTELYSSLASRGGDFSGYRRELSLGVRHLF